MGVERRQRWDTVEHTLVAWGWAPDVDECLLRAAVTIEGSLPPLEHGSPFRARLGRCARSAAGRLAKAMVRAVRRRKKVEEARAALAPAMLDFADDVTHSPCWPVLVMACHPHGDYDAIVQKVILGETEYASLAGSLGARPLTMAALVEEGLVDALFEELAEDIRAGPYVKPLLPAWRRRRLQPDTVLLDVEKVLSGYVRDVGRLGGELAFELSGEPRPGHDPEREELFDEIRAEVRRRASRWPAKRPVRRGTSTPTSENSPR